MSAALSEVSDFSDRFWYWRGASGRRYIHSIYSSADCPSFPGAVCVFVRKLAEQRVAVALMRLADDWDEAQIQARSLVRGSDEVHVHLLADGGGEAAAILKDLSAGLGIVQKATGKAREPKADKTPISYPDADRNGAQKSGFSEQPLLPFHPASSSDMSLPVAMFS